MILAGKGHEPYQVLKDRVIHFDDREVARDVLRELGYRETLVAGEWSEFDRTIGAGD